MAKDIINISILLSSDILFKFNLNLLKKLEKIETLINTKWWYSVVYRISTNPLLLLKCFVN